MQKRVCCGTDGAAGERSFRPNLPRQAHPLLVGFAAGGPTDVAARVVGERLAEVFGKPVIVENITGAAGNIAADRVAKAAPDGYTLLAAASATIVTNINLYQKLSFDPVKDFAPITQVASTPNILVVPNDVAGEERRRTGRARTRQSRADLRLGRHRHVAASRRRAVQDDGEDRHPARALPRHRGRGARPARRAARPRVRQHHRDAAAGARGQGPRARDHVAASAGRRCRSCRP